MLVRLQRVNFGVAAAGKFRDRSAAVAAIPQLH
jgi:hypothetical protein